MRVSRFAKLALLAAVMASAASVVSVSARAEEAELAWLRDSKLEAVTLGDQTALQGTSADKVLNDKVPLGSLWKLFVYAYLSETHATESAYACSKVAATAMEAGEDHYCCNPGESIARDPALARSCAPYFSPARLGISAVAWQAQWKPRSKAPWLLDMAYLRPETVVRVSDLLAALQAITPQARSEARAALLETGVDGYGREAWPQLGSGIRYKTYSWHRADGSAFGGAAGWLADGTPFWFGARGSSRTALTAWAGPLAKALPQPRWSEAGAATADASCVDVDFFARYPLRTVLPAQGSTPVAPGTLNGRYRVQFTNGNWLNVNARGELTLVAVGSAQGGSMSINGRMSINDYVARVVDREGLGSTTQAARALAIAARSYLLQNGNFEGACWHIADSSQTQRVSANPPSDAALSAAWFTDDMVLNGAPVHYHSDSAGDNRLSWNMAVTHATAGWNFEQILNEAYPKATLATMSGRTECSRLDAAETWLDHAAAGWKSRLEREPGFEPMDKLPKVCALPDGHPYSDQRRLRIYVRGWRSLDERITLAHEYLHLAFRFHPHGADEEYIEHLARQLIEG